ncbi:chalcone--flavonone isomerase 1B-1 [Senna tora]|uniref:Chalcone-flavonone isomerase family protein n=1 Tax=Senna tora TaxID=362788 RepID=A0A834SWL2_9FABA|nr:chalcone--flavonone isomerase 1B-1 [Senna tora]
MATASSLPGVQVEFIEFPATITPPAGSVKSYFLGGAGERGLVIDGNFIKFTAIGVYLEDKALPLLASNWKGKSEDELSKSLQFFRDIITGPYEKLIRGSKILPLSGEEYVKKVSENCVGHLKSVGSYDEEEAKAIEEMIQAFKGHHFKPGSSVFYKQSPHGTLTISFSEDATLPEDEGVVIKNKAASMAVLETMIGHL